jgi:hypothetical protein
VNAPRQVGGRAILTTADESDTILARRIDPMKRLSTVVLVMVVVASLAVIGSVEAGKKVKIKERKGQVTQTFVNNSGAPAYGLRISLSAEAIVETDDEHRAGPFGNVQGNDSKELILTNPDEPLEDAGSLELTFRSYKPKLEVKSWVWLDEKGKKLGKKNKS